MTTDDAERAVHHTASDTVSDTVSDTDSDTAVDSGFGEAADDTDDDILDAILGRLRAAADEIDAPPAIVDELARAAFETRDLDTELAVLTADSFRDELELVRSGTVEARMVSFETGSVTVELQFERNDNEQTVLRGLLIGSAGPVTVDTGDRRSEVPVDQQGWFTLDDVPSGALRLRVTAANGASVTTEWISV